MKGYRFILSGKFQKVNGSRIPRKLKKYFKLCEIHQYQDNPKITGFSLSSNNKYVYNNTYYIVCNHKRKGIWYHRTINKIIAEKKKHFEIRFKNAFSEESINKFKKEWSQFLQK